MSFADRHHAGRRLAEALHSFADERPVVVALPRGGVPVAAEVARALGAPLDVLAVRKLGAPGRPEYGVGAVAEGGVGVLDPGAARATGLRDGRLDETLRRESRELARRVEAYRDGRPPVNVRGRTAIVVDDGLATGLTAIAAVRALRERGAAKVVVAVPVASAGAVADVGREADDVVCVEIPEPFLAVGAQYDDFDQVGDDEVIAALDDLWDPVTPFSLELGDRVVRADLGVPADPRGLVVFAHGSGSSRRSPRNRAVAQRLQDAGFATVLADLLDDAEARRRDRVFDVALLASRLEAIVGALREQPLLGRLPLGLFGASTGAAAALVAAADLGPAVSAVVSRGGRPDLAAGRLRDVTAPTLLIVGGADTEVLALNRRAAQELRAPCELTIVPGATHLFEEPGALEQVAEHAIAWFDRCLTGDPRAVGVDGGAR